MVNSSHKRSNKYLRRNNDEISDKRRIDDECMKLLGEARLVVDQPKISL